MRTLKLQIDGMSCASCASAVEKALAAAPGVQHASVNFLSRTATVSLLPTESTVASGTEQALIAAVRKAGYQARVQPGCKDLRDEQTAWWEIARTAGIGALLLMGWALGSSPFATALVITATALAAYPIFLRAGKALLAKR